MKLKQKAFKYLKYFPSRNFHVKTFKFTLVFKTPRCPNKTQGKLIRLRATNLQPLRYNSEKAMAPHSSTLAWKIPWTEEPGGLQSMGSLSRSRLSNFTFTFHFHALEKKMATHSSVLAWRIPGTGEPGGLQSMGSHRVGHD